MPAPTLPTPLQYPLGSIATSTYLIPQNGHRSNIFYVGAPVRLQLQMNGPGLTYDGSTTTANAYTVRDLTGTIVASGSIPPVFVPPPGGVGKADGATITLTPTAGGNWKPGWYRVYLTGPTSDSYRGFAYGVSNFVVLRDNPSFFHNPDSHGATEDAGAESRDVILKQILGMGGSRLTIANAALSDPAHPFLPGNNIPPGSYTGDSLWSCANGADAELAYQPGDPARSTIPFCQFPNGTVDSANLFTIGRAYCKNDTLDGTKLFVSAGNGTSSGVKVTVYFPNSSTVVETYDNQPNADTACAAVNASSNYIWMASGGGTTQTVAATAVGNSMRKGVINTVQYLFPHGVKHYEGPSNEPNGGGGPNAETAQQMKLFQAYVHAGNAAAKAIGPCPVDINNLTAWQAFFDAGGGAWCDEISTHMYSGMVAGDFNLGRHKFDAWWDLLARNGQAGKKVWVTESTQAGGVSGVSVDPYGPKQILPTILLLEQYGVPREQNLIWYDRSHGFWNVPNFLEYGDQSIAPHGVFCRVMAEETLGQLHHHTLDFGSVQGNRMFLGSVFKHVTDGTQTAMVVTAGRLPNATVTFGINGTVPASFTCCDGQGNTSTVSVSAGKVTVPIDPIATYLRVPSGTSVYVSSCNDWGATPPTTISPSARAKYHGTDYKPGVVDNTVLTDYGGGAGFTMSTVPVPDTAEAVWNSTVNVDRVIVIAGLASQPYSTLTDFDVQTTTDGTTWTTRQTVTVDILQNVFAFPNDGRNSASTQEAYWDRQWIFDVPLGSTYACTGIRLNVRATSYGGAENPQLAAGYGNSIQSICLQEIMVPSASSTTPYTASYASLVSAHSGLLGYWRMGEATGVSTAHSEVNSPTVDGTYGVTSPHTSKAAPGATSDGNTARVSIGGATFNVAANGTLIFGDTFTIEFWHNSFNGAAADRILQVPLTGGAQFDINYLGGVAYSLNDGASIELARTTNTSDPHDSNWHHVAVTKTGSAIHLYVDGKDVTGSTTNKTLVNGDGRLVMFAPGGGSNGYDELAVYNVVLTPTEIVDHYNAATLPTAAPSLDATFSRPGPVVSGSASPGGQLQSSQGIWVNAPTGYTYQWQLSPNGSTGWTNVSGATRSDFIVDIADVSLFARCLVTASNVIGAGTAAPSSVTVVGLAPGGAIANSAAPVVSGTVAVGSTLSCTTGTWTGSPTTFVYQWQTSVTGTGGWGDIAGATNPTFVVPAPDAGLFIRCGVAAS